jgi:hypothetical protein
MTDDPNAKPPPPPPPPPGITVEGDWPYFLRQPTDPGERARRAQQTADEQREQAADEQRERELKQRERLRTTNARTRKAAKELRRKEVFIRAAETVAVKRTPWQVAGDALEQANKILASERLRLTDQHGIYHVIRVPHVWARLTSLRKR